MIIMDYIYQRLGNEKIDLLKVDIEGMEWEVLKKMTKTDFEKIDQITIKKGKVRFNTKISKTPNSKIYKKADATFIQKEELVDFLVLL